MIDEPSSSEFAEWAAEKRYQRALRAHPDPRDPDHPEDPREHLVEALVLDLEQVGKCDLGTFEDLLEDLEPDSIFYQWLIQSGKKNHRIFTTDDPKELMELRNSLRTYLAYSLAEQLT